MDYLAIVVGGISFGPRGGLITAAMAGMSRTALQQFGFNRPLAGQGELTVFMLIGLLAGFFAEHKSVSRHLGRHAEGTSSSGQNGWLEPSRPAPYPALGQQLPPGLVHQLRTPLASIEGAGFVLEDGTLPDDKRRELVAIILKECQQLNLLIGLMESEQPLRSEHATIDIAVLVDDVVRRALEAAPFSQLSIEKQTVPDLPGLHVNREAVEQAVLNIVLNAMNAMPEGGKILVASRLVHGEFLIQVTDERPRVDADRLHWAVNSAPMGYWPELELAISQRIVARHGGAMRIEQNTGGGLTFSVILPQASGAHA